MTDKEALILITQLNTSQWCTPATKDVKGIWKCLFSMYNLYKTSKKNTVITEA